MRRREFLALLGGVALTRSIAARAQQSSIPVIGYLSSGSPESDTLRLTGLRWGLSEAGYVEGQNVAIEYRWAENQSDRLPALADDLAQQRVAVIIAPGVASTLAAKAATKTIPIVFVISTDPVQLGLVPSLNRPGGNLTGISAFGREVAAKGLEVLHELLPATASVGFLENPSNPIGELQKSSIVAAARAIGVEIQILHASTEGELDAAFASLARTRTGALVVSTDYFFNGRPNQLVALAARYAVPTIYSIREFAMSGGLISYGVSNAEVYRLTGLHVARVLKGEKPGDQPVIQITKIELVINLKTAKALGLTIPPSLLARTDEIIE
jgi:putative ABC transport system substrate-binding protein